MSGLCPLQPVYKSILLACTQKGQVSVPKIKIFLSVILCFSHCSFIYLRNLALRRNLLEFLRGLSEPLMNIFLFRHAAHRNHFTVDNQRWSSHYTVPADFFHVFNMH